MEKQELEFMEKKRRGHQTILKKIKAQGKIINPFENL